MLVFKLFWNWRITGDTTSFFLSFLHEHKEEKCEIRSYQWTLLQGIKMPSLCANSSEVITLIVRAMRTSQIQAAQVTTLHLSHQREKKKKRSVWAKHSSGNWTNHIVMLFVTPANRKHLLISGQKNKVMLRFTQKAPIRTSVPLDSITVLSKSFL